MEEARNEKMKQLIADFPALEEIDYEVKLIPGIPDQSIKVFAREMKADLIVMGTEGASGWEEFLMGTNGEKVTRNAPCSVLVIPDGKTFKYPDQIALAIDEDSLENEAQLEVLSDIAQALNCQIKVVHIEEGKKEEAEHHVRQQLQTSQGVLSSDLFILNDEDDEHALQHFLDKHHIDILALIYREHNFLERTFKPGLRKRMLFHSDKPILILK
jgi:hypothetical protein